MPDRTQSLLELLSLQLTLAAMDQSGMPTDAATRERHTNLERRIEGRQFTLGLFKDTMLTAKVTVTMVPNDSDKELATQASLWSNDDFMDRAFEASINGFDVDFVVNTAGEGTQISGIHETVRERPE